MGIGPGIRCSAYPPNQFAGESLLPRKTAAPIREFLGNKPSALNETPRVRCSDPIVVAFVDFPCGKNFHQKRQTAGCASQRNVSSSQHLQLLPVHLSLTRYGISAVYISFAQPFRELCPAQSSCSFLDDDDVRLNNAGGVIAKSIPPSKW